MHAARTIAPLVLAASIASACDEAGTGDAVVLVASEETIVSGLEPGDGEENVADGWTVTFDTYVLAIGPVELGRSSGGASVVSEGARVVDLRAVGAGAELARFEAIDAGRWDRFAFETPLATAETPCDASVDPDDCEDVRAAGLTYLIRGTLTKPGGESCPPSATCRATSAIGFELAVAAATRYASCETDGVGGISVPEGGASSDAVWIHGDHLFFNVFGGDEGTVVRRAQWLANADLDGDDFVDMAELGEVELSDFPLLFPGFSTDYSFTGSPLPIANAADFVRAQLSTQGHLNGEGECTPEVL